MALTSARLAARENRFVLRCTLPSGEEVAAHLGNTGRLRELLTPGAELLLRHNPRPWPQDPVGGGAGEGGGAVGEPQFPAAEPPRRPGRPGRGDFTAGFSPALYGQTGGGGRGFRIDIAAVKPDGETFYLEVKGVTLVREGIAQFPDAPTDRGVKHLHELTRIAREGGRAGVLFIVQRPDARLFHPEPRPAGVCCRPPGGGGGGGGRPRLEMPGG